MSPRALTASALIAAAGTPALAQFQVYFHSRELSVLAEHSSLVGTNTQQNSSMAPGVGPWMDSLSVSAFPSSASASMNSTVTEPELRASGQATADAPVPQVSEGNRAAAVSRYRARFTVGLPTTVLFSAAIPTASLPNPLTAMVTRQTVQVQLQNLTTGAVLARVAACFGCVPPGGPHIDPPVELVTRLSFGEYEVLAEVDLEGQGARNNNPYSASASYTFSLKPYCYANCDASTAVPVLNVNDLVCFMNRYAAEDPYANCDQSTALPTLSISDFVCFLNQFAGGCS